jgi:hypothetical protein
MLLPGAYGFGGVARNHQLPLIEGQWIAVE